MMSWRCCCSVLAITSNISIVAEGREWPYFRAARVIERLSRAAMSSKRGNGYDRDMAIVHMSEAELVSNIADVMRQVRQGNEIVIEQGNRLVAVIKPSKPAG